MALDWQLVSEGLRAGRYNLLLGAGASLDSFRPDNTNLPSLGGLQSELSSALPNVRPNSSINRLYRTLKAEDRVDELITAQMKGCRAGPTNRTISEFRWKRIFTLNIDDALEDAYSQNTKRLQEPQVFNFNEPYSEIRNNQEVPIIHLHGYSRKSEDGYVFDIKEYVSNISSNNIWSHILGGLIRSEPFVIAGTSLEESDLAYFLSDRSNLRLRQDAPPSIIIEPFPDAATSTDCHDFRLSLFHGTVIDFFEEATKRVGDRPTVFDQSVGNVGEIDVSDLERRLVSEFNADFERVPLSSEITGGTQLNFAYGHRADWGDLKADLDRSRDAQVRLQSELMSTEGIDFFLISGGAGAGKTTSLRRTAYNLSQLGNYCFWHRALGRVRIDALKSICSASEKPIFLFVDNVADYIVEFLEIRQAFSNRELRIICAERDYRTNHIKRVIGDSKAREFRLAEIGRPLAKSLVSDYNAMGLASPQNGIHDYPIAEDLIAIACCRILNDFQPLEKIIGRSIADSNRVERTCYMFVALANYCFRQGVSYDVVSRRYPDYLVDIMAEDEESSLPIEIGERSGVEFVQPLNEAFSDSILRQWTSENKDDALNIFIDLAESIRPKVSLRAIIDGEPAARLASRLFDYDEVVRPFLGMELAEVFFERTKKAWDWNSRYWHQVASLRLDLAHAAEEKAEKDALCEIAAQHARFTKGIEPNHQFTHTMIGRVLFRKAEILGHVKPAELTEAISALIKAIDIEGRKGRLTMHPFMILFTGLNSVFELGARVSHDEKGKILELVRKATQLFPRETKMLEAAHQVRSSL